MTVNEISFFTPLLAIGFGLLSFASPCCLPLLPAYLGMIAGSSGTARMADARRSTLLWNGLGFVAGLAADRAVGWAHGLRTHLGLIERAGGVVLVAMGVLLFTGQLTMINVWAIRTFGLGLAL